MVKPVGPACNYDCDYCFYTAKRALYPKPARLRLPEPVLEAFLRGILDGRAASVQLCWQGGEPTLAGLDFLRRAVELAERLRPEGMQLEHSLQTNGSLIDETWAEFLGQTGILVGLSIDGPKALTDHYRRDRKGRPTYERTRRALDLLLQRGVAVNTLTVVHRKNVREGRRIYRFLRQAGVDLPVADLRAQRTDVQSVGRTGPVLHRASYNSSGFTDHDPDDSRCPERPRRVLTDGWR